MIFLANDCVGARMYQQLNCEFNNPFCWHRISYSDFVFLINNIHDINFNKVDAKLIKNPEGSNCCLLKIDDRINVAYVHYIQSNTHNTPKKIEINIYYNDIIKYTLNKYKNRVDRMNLNDEIVLILHQKNDYNGYNATKQDCIDFINQKFAFRKILIVSDKTLLKYKNNDTEIIYCHENMTTGNIAKTILETVKL